MGRACLPLPKRRVVGLMRKQRTLFAQLSSLFNRSVFRGRRRRSVDRTRFHSAALQSSQFLERRCLLSASGAGEPRVEISKGVVASSNASANFDSDVGPLTAIFSTAGNTDQPFSGLITSESIRTGSTPRPLSANLRNAEPGDIVRLALLLENQSTDGTAFDVTVRDSLPAGLAYIPNSLIAVDGTGAVLSFEDLDNSNDGSGLFGLGIRLDDPGSTAGRFAEPQDCGALDANTTERPGRNIAIIFYDARVENLPGNSALLQTEATLNSFAQSEGGTNLSTGKSASAEITLQRIDLEITKSVSNANPLAADIVTWTIDVTNNASNATTAATGVVVRDTMPTGQSFIPGSATFPVGGSFNPTTGIWDVGQPIAEGSTVRLSFQTRVAESVEFRDSVVDVELTGTIDATDVRSGDIIEYTISVQNNPEIATADATGVIISDLLPSGLTLLSHSASEGTFDQTTAEWNLAATPLTPGEKNTLRVIAQVDDSAAGTTIEFATRLKDLNETDADSLAGNAAGAEDDDVRMALAVLPNGSTRTVTGRVFLDVNNDGLSAGDVGVGGIIVNAYGPDESLAGTSTTNASGDYSIPNITAEAVRIEFVGLDSSHSLATTPTGSIGTSSSLGFLEPGSTDATANLAIYQPHASAEFVTTCFVYSGQSTLNPTTEPAVVAFNADGTLKVTLATIAEVGATNGVAVHSSSGDQFFAAFHKRHSDIGPSGNSAVYRIDAESGAISTFIRLDDFRGLNSAGPYSHDPANWFTDAPAFESVGKVSLGDLAVSEDGRFLYTVNLATRELVEIPVSQPGSSTPDDYVAGDTRTIRTVSILGDDLVNPANGGIPADGLGIDPIDNIRPFGLAVRGGLIYVGMVNTAQSTQGLSDLEAFVYTFDPATGRFSTSAAASFLLGTRTLGNGWQPWTDIWDDLPKFYDAAGDYFAVGTNQPWLTDIEFDSNGDMILGFRDRTGDQIGHMVGDPTGADSDSNGSPDRYFHDTKGDILRLRQTSPTSWTVEPGQLLGDGSEYYNGDEAQFDSIAASLHPEVAQGGLAIIPGFKEVATTAIDPQSFWAGGVDWLDNVTGTQKDQVDIYSGSDESDITTFGKNNGLGDLEYLENLTTEIGNRIWNDLNGDGIQNAAEPPIADVRIQLFDMSNPAAPQLVGSITSDANGNYLFNSSNVSYIDGGKPAGLRVSTAYEIRIDGAEFQPGGALHRFRSTLTNQTPAAVGRDQRLVSGSAEFDTDLDGTADTARNQRIDVLSTTGLRTDGVRVQVLNATGGLARVDHDQSIIFEFSDGSVEGRVEYEIIDDRLDSDGLSFDDNGDGMTDRAVIPLTIPADGQTSHSFDFGFVEGKVDLELNKYSSRKTARAGDAVSFTVTVTNNLSNADTAATGVTIRDSIPSGATLLPGTVSASQGTFDGSVWVLPNPISPGETVILTYQASIDTGTPGSILINAAEVNSVNETDVDSSPTNDDGDRSEDDEDDAAVLVGSETSQVVIYSAQIIAANESDFDSNPDNNNHDDSEDDEANVFFTISTATNVYDFGDLPDVYRTLSSSGGPSHRRGSGTFLGTTVDDETDGQPSPTAIGDGSDDDGIRFLSPLLPGTTAQIEVTASTSGFLNAWFDFDDDGTFEEIDIAAIDGVEVASLTAANDLPLSAGVHSLAIIVPQSAAGNMAARFRFTSDRMNAWRSTGGQWANGEVEDYRLRQIGDRVWQDLDGDGIPDPTTEAGIANVPVTLTIDLNNDGTNETFETTTDEDGLYVFPGLPEGDYNITVGIPDQHSATFDIDGTSDGSADISLSPATLERLDVDFGFQSDIVAPNEADLRITKYNEDLSGAASVGGEVVYTIVVANSGPADVSEATVQDSLPEQFVGATWTASGSVGTTFQRSGTGSLEETISLPAGGSVTYKVTATLNDTFTGEVTNTATISTSVPESDLTNNIATDTISVTPLTLTPLTPALPGETFEISASGMSHVALVPFIVGTTPGSGTINGVPVDIADPEILLVGFVCIDDQIIALYDIPPELNGETLYFQTYEALPTPRLSNVVEVVVGAPRLIADRSTELTSVTEGSTTETVSLSLSDAPASDVTVEIQSLNPARLQASPATLRFTSSNWNVAQSVEFEAIDDSLPNSDISTNVRASVRSGSDASYVTAIPVDLAVNVIDNDFLARPIVTNNFASTTNQRPTFTWSPIAGADSYDLWMSPAGDTSNPVFNTNVFGTSFRPPADLGIGRFDMWIRARSASNEVSAWSTVAQFDVSTPAIVSSVEGLESRSRSFNWTSVPGAIRYEIWINNQTAGRPKVLHNVNVTDTNFDAIDLDFGIHAFWVRPINSRGRVGQWSAANSFFIGPDLLGPLTPTFETRPTFAWSEIPGAESFEIYLQTGNTVLRQGNLTTTSFTPSINLEPGRYRWWVRGYAANGRAGQWSVPGSTNVGGRPSITTPAAETSGNGNLFQWSSVIGADRYSIYIAGVDDSTFVFRDDAVTTNRIANVPGLQSGQSYRVWVRAISISGTLSPWSFPVTFQLR